MIPQQISPLQLRKQEVVRDEIWNAATDLFLEKGFDETTVEDIAARAGISRRTFFRYFSSKNDLMAQGVLSYGTILTEAINACPRKMHVREVFKTTVMIAARSASAHPNTSKIMKIAATYPAARAAQLARMSEVQEQIASAYASRGIDRAHNYAPGILAGLTLSILAIAFRAWFDQGQPDITRIVDQIFETLTTVLP
jgi:AcrR family transcriptional regulator